MASAIDSIRISLKPPHGLHADWKRCAILLDRQRHRATTKSVGNACRTRTQGCQLAILLEADERAGENRGRARLRWRNPRIYLLHCRPTGLAQPFVTPQRLDISLRRSRQGRARSQPPLVTGTID